MGCAYNVPILKPTKNVQSPVGLLYVQVQKIFINDKNPIFKTPQNGLIISISNHQFQITSDVVNDCNKNIKKIAFTCFINSFYKQFGRILIATLYNETMDKKFKNQTRAFGIIDLNPFIFHKSDSQFTKCYINFSKNSIGYLDLKIKFKNLDYSKLIFSLMNFQMEKNIQELKRLCYCKVTAGEQILETDMAAETDIHNASWKNQPLEFHIPQGLEQITIEIFEKKSQNDILIGQGQLKIEQMIKYKAGDQIKIMITDQNKKNIGKIELKLLQQGINQDFCSQKVIQSMRILQGKSSKENQTQASTNVILTQKRLPPLKNNLHNKITSLDNLSKEQQNQKSNQFKKKEQKLVSLKIIPQKYQEDGDFIKPQQEQQQFSNHKKKLIKQNQLFENQRSSIIQQQQIPTDSFMVKTKQQNRLTVVLPCLKVEI